MLAIEINRSLCTKCGKCIDICCNSRVIAADEDNYPIYKNIHKCISCGHCIAICPQNAISTKNTRPSDKYFIITESRPLVKPHLSPEHIHSLLAEIRSERTFTNKQVEKEKLEQVLEVMMQSPSAGNEQNRNYYIFTNQADIQSLEEDIQTMNMKQTGNFTNPLF